ncbi:hypothetical protein [Vibrio ishigakensis]|uniref:hypothetical protein n=1 Tax=Vibrio ishigakensis TaxID=1481914 RepID=UPI0021C25B04|nr:hypothetical protein [Vibrio ishigakensis]
MKPLKTLLLNVTQFIVRKVEITARCVYLRSLLSELSAGEELYKKEWCGRKEQKFIDRVNEDLDTLRIAVRSNRTRIVRLRNS